MKDQLQTIRAALAILEDIGENDMYAEEWQKTQQALTALEQIEQAVGSAEPVAAQQRFRHPQKNMPSWSVWQPCKIKNRPSWEIDSQGYEVEYRELFTTPPVQGAGKWGGGESWESLAWQLCADEHGEDACNELIWEGGPVPEPWGDRWMKYGDEAKRLISLVHKHTNPPAQQQVSAFRAPTKTAWGNGMVCIDIELGKDSTATLFFDRDDTTKVEQRFGVVTKND